MLKEPDYSIIRGRAQRSIEFRVKLLSILSLRIALTFSFQVARSGKRCPEC